jgi:hypothetical protein
MRKKKKRGERWKGIVMKNFTLIFSQEETFSAFSLRPNQWWHFFRTLRQVEEEEDQKEVFPQ